MSAATLDANHLSDLCQAVSRRDPRWTDGECLTFALALQELLDREGVPNDLQVGYRQVFAADGEPLDQTLSHVVVGALGTNFDCGGSLAIERWESRWDPPFQDENGEISKFEWVPALRTEIPDLPSRVAVPPTPEELARLQDRFRSEMSRMVAQKGLPVTPEVARGF